MTTNNYLFSKINEIKEKYHSKISIDEREYCDSEEDCDYYFIFYCRCIISITALEIASKTSELFLSRKLKLGHFRSLIKSNYVVVPPGYRKEFLYFLDDFEKEIEKLCRIRLFL